MVVNNIMTLDKISDRGGIASILVIRFKKEYNVLVIPVLTFSTMVVVETFMLLV